MQIRPATAADTESLYDVCLRTGDAGGDASHLFDDPTLLGSIFVGPYLALDGTLAFAAVDDQGTGGYVLAATDTHAFEHECEVHWWPRLRALHPDPGPGADTADAELQRYIHRPPRQSPDIVETFPAHLHIDLLPRFQGTGVGLQMMDTMVAALRRSGVVGVHLGVDVGNPRAIRFYERFGFSTRRTVGDERIMVLPLVPPRTG